MSIRRWKAELVALTGLAFSTVLVAGSANAEIPDWVPERYHKFFVRHVDERPTWERALNNLGVNIGETGRSFALVAGVSRYPNMAGRERNLAPARVDVEKMAAYLAAEPESFNEIIVLLDGDVTKENLNYFLTNYFPQRLAEAPRSRFLFAYSGHGMTATNGRGYLLTDKARNLQDRFHAGISLATLRADFQEVVDTGHHVLALINACYGASFHRLSLAFGDRDPLPPRREGAHAITAGGAGELVWHDPTIGDGSVFFEMTLAALDGRADRLPNDGVVTVGELQTHLETTISRFTDERQNPEGGDLVATRSPGGFFFLDRRRQEEEGVVSRLNRRWWVSFGENSALEPIPNKRQTGGEFYVKVMKLLDHANNDFISLRSHKVIADSSSIKYELEENIIKNCDESSEFIFSGASFVYRCTNSQSHRDIAKLEVETLNIIIDEDKEWHFDEDGFCGGLIYCVNAYNLSTGVGISYKMYNKGSDLTITRY